MNSYKNLQYEEYGLEHKQVVMLLHGTLLSVWNYQNEIAALSERYHVILPYIDGHDQATSDFVSIDAMARKLVDFINVTFQGHIALLGGLSLGGQVALDMMSLKCDICDYAIIESVKVTPQRGLVPSLSPYILPKNKLMAKGYYRTLSFPKALFEPCYASSKALKKENIKKIIHAEAHFKMPETLAQTKAKVYIEVGSKEGDLIKQAHKLHRRIDKSQLLLMYRYRYGDFSMNHSQSYINLIEKLLRK